VTFTWESNDVTPIITGLPVEHKQVAAAAAAAAAAAYSVQY